MVERREGDENGGAPPPPLLCSAAMAYRDVLPLTLLFVGAGGCGGAAALDEPHGRTMPETAASPRIEIHGHRGARGTHPENTLPAFRAALDVGVDVLELDLGFTQDEALVVYHDEALNCDITRDDNGWLTEARPLRTIAAADLEGLDVGRIRPGSEYASRFAEQGPIDGTRIPRFEDVLALGARLNVEIKTSPSWPSEEVEAFTRAAIGAVRTAGAEDRVNLQSFDFRSLLLARQVAPEIERACLTAEDTMAPDVVARWTAGRATSPPSSVPDLVAEVGCQIWSPNHSTLDRAAVRRAHELGLRVTPWTVNEVEDIRRAARLGVDAVITDYPARAAVELARLGHRP